MHTVEKELIEVTGYKLQRKFINRQDYLGSILNAVMKLSNDAFDDISDEAATWTNAAVQAHNAKNEDLPDFDEVVSSEEVTDETTPDSDSDPEGVDDPDDPEDEVDDETSPEADEPPEEVEVSEPEVEKPKPAKKAKAEVPKKYKAPPVEPPRQKVKIQDEEVILDKWGCMEGSKNGQALALFEKGATAKEVKEAIGGTYYNILARVVKDGHKMEKEGALIKITHRDEVGKKPKKK